jgi:hypothetical protein
LEKRTEAQATSAEAKMQGFFASLKKGWVSADESRQRQKTGQSDAGKAETVVVNWFGVVGSAVSSLT